MSQVNERSFRIRMRTNSDRGLYWYNEIWLYLIYILVTLGLLSSASDLDAMMQWPILGDSI